MSSIDVLTEPRVHPRGPTIEWVRVGRGPLVQTPLLFQIDRSSGDPVLPESEPIVGRWSSTEATLSARVPHANSDQDGASPEVDDPLVAHRGRLYLSVSARRTVGVITGEPAQEHSSLEPGDEVLTFSWEHRDVGRVTARRRRRFLRHTDTDVALWNGSGAATLLVLPVARHLDVDSEPTAEGSHMLGLARTIAGEAAQATNSIASVRVTDDHGCYEETITFKALR